MWVSRVLLCGPSTSRFSSLYAALSLCWSQWNTYQSVSSVSGNQEPILSLPEASWVLERQRFYLERGSPDPAPCSLCSTPHTCVGSREVGDEHRVLRMDVRMQGLG